MTTFLIILFFFTFSSVIEASYCPTNSDRGTVYSARLIASQQKGNYALNTQKQISTYQHIFTTEFQTTPQLAISTIDFQFQPSKSIFYSIKPLKTESNTLITLLIRTQWEYTVWHRISFMVLAEDRVDVQSGYYMVDSGALAVAGPGRKIAVFLPFRSQFVYGPLIQECVFLHGFQISTVEVYNGKRSPFELQIQNSLANQTGIMAELSVTTQTEVNSIYLSYVAFQLLELKINYGFHYFEQGNSQNIIYHVPQLPTGMNYARIFGLTGFIIKYKENKISFSKQWDGVKFQLKFQFPSKQLLAYFSFKYIFFLGSHCQHCIGYNISYNNQCLNQCPQGTYKTHQNNCISCGEGRVHNGVMCVTICPKDNYDNLTNICVCPFFLNWDGQYCIPCLYGYKWNKVTKKCQCQPPYFWNGKNCLSSDDCTNGKIWDSFTHDCVCPDGTNQFESICKQKKKNLHQN